MRALAFREGRRVLVVVTDGQYGGGWAKRSDFSMELGYEDPAADTSSQQLLEFIDRNDVLVYAISFEGSTFDPTVQRAAQRSGGLAFRVKRDTDLHGVFRQIVAELRSQYLVSFRPAVLDNKVRPLTVRMSREGVTIHAREEYEARPRVKRF